MAAGHGAFPIGVWRKYTALAICLVCCSGYCTVLPGLIRLEGLALSCWEALAVSPTLGTALPKAGASSKLTLPFWVARTLYVTLQRCTGCPAFPCSPQGGIPTQLLSLLSPTPSLPSPRMLNPRSSLSQSLHLIVVSGLSAFQGAQHVQQLILWSGHMLNSILWA